MMRQCILALAVSAHLLISACDAFADGNKSAQLEPFTDTIQFVLPQRVCKVRLVNGQVFQVGPWRELGDIAPASDFPPHPRGSGRIAFDNMSNIPNKYGDPCISAPWYFGPNYYNRIWVNDIERMFPGTEGAQADALAVSWYMQRTLGNTSNFIMAIFTGEYEDGTLENFNNCDDTGLYFFEGIALDYGNRIGSGGWYSVIVLPEELSLQMPRTGQGVYSALYLSSLSPPTCWPDPAQPFLWGTPPGNPSQQGPIQWDESDPPTCTINLPSDCVRYEGERCPIGATIAFWVPEGCVPSDGDINGDGCVDDADLLAVLFAFGSTGGSEDVNCDGIVDDADLLEVLFNFGQGC